ncbi:hypothetical protein Tco_0205485 [Tanacetum coccineum]
MTTTIARKTMTGSKTHKQSSSQSALVEETMQSTGVFKAPAHQEFKTGVHDEQAEEEVHHFPDWFQQPKRLPSPDHAWNKSVVIQRRVEDLQLGVKSYQKKLNLTKPDTYRSNLRRRDSYTHTPIPEGFIYENKAKKEQIDAH